MPVERCQSDGRPGFRWGSAGTCYTYEPGNTSSRRRARNRAQEQGAAIEANKRADHAPAATMHARKFDTAPAVDAEQRGQGRIVKVDSWRQVVFAEVYVPDYPDSHGDYASAESIEKMAHGFLRNGLTNQVDVEHNNETGGGYLVESFIARKGDPDFIAGSWVAAVKIEDAALWQQVLDGEINGFSFEGLARTRPGEVEIEVRETLTVKTAESKGHTHKVFLRFDPETGEFLGGQTDPGPDGHVHTATKGTITDRAGSPRHAHRFSYIEEVQ